MIGYGMCGSFCTIKKSILQLERLVGLGYDVQPFMSEILYNTDTRFGKASDIIEKVEAICGRRVIHSIVDAEPFGPSTPLDCLILSPCTGNTLAKLANGITDTAVCMVTKAHLRNNGDVIIALASNDALSANLKNIAAMRSRKNVYFVPMSMDDPQNKPHSLVADFDMVIPTFESVIKKESAH